MTRARARNLGGEESGLLASPIALTNTAQVGLVRDAITRYAVDRFGRRGG